MSYLNEDEADAFFHEGDAGTYDGGPALSLAPVGMADLSDDEEDKPKPPSPEQIARRERLKRLVTTVVSTLGIGSVLVFALRITRQDSDTASAAPLAVREASGATTPPAIRAEPVINLPAVPAVPRMEAPAPAAVAAPAPQDAIAEAPKTPASPEPVQVAKPTVRAVAVTRSVPSNHPSTGERATTRAEHVSGGRPSIPKASQGYGASASGHSPPTATFPD